MFENAMHCGPCIAAGICMPVADRNGRPAFLSATIPAQAWSDESPRIPQMAFFLKSNGALSAIPFAQIIFTTVFQNSKNTREKISMRPLPFRKGFGRSKSPSRAVSARST